MRAWGERRGLWANLAARGEPPSRRAKGDRAFRGQVADELVGVAEYLAMRAARSPAFMGLRLDTDAGWNDAVAMIREIAALGLPGAAPPAPPDR